MNLDKDFKYENGFKLYDSFSRCFYHENGRKMYDGLSGECFYTNGAKAYDELWNDIFYENGTKVCDRFWNATVYPNGRRVDGLDRIQSLELNDRVTLYNSVGEIKYSIRISPDASFDFSRTDDNKITFKLFLFDKCLINKIINI